MGGCENSSDGVGEPGHEGGWWSDSLSDRKADDSELSLRYDRPSSEIDEELEMMEGVWTDGGHMYGMLSGL